MKPALLTSIVLPLVLTLSAWAQTGAQLSPAVSSLLEPHIAGTDNVIVLASGLTGTEHWQVNIDSGSSDWITVLPNQGNGISFQNDGNLLRFQLTANTGPARSATVSITGGATAANLTVTQAGSSFVHAGLLTLASSANGLLGPMGIAADNQGDLYIADSPSRTTFEWVASSQQLIPVNNGLAWIGAYDLSQISPWGVTLDAAGDLFFLYTFENSTTYAVAELPVNQQTAQVLWNSDQVQPVQVCVDAAGQNVDLSDGINTGSCAIDLLGNTWASDPSDQAISKHTPGNQTSFLTFPFTSQGPGVITYSTGGGVPSGLSVDNGDFLYYLDLNGTRLMRYDTSSTQGQLLMVAVNLNPAFFSAVDSARNIYLSEGSSQRIRVLPNAYISSMGPFVETSAAGTESIQVLPATQNLTGIYAPVSSDPSWLTVQSAANGVVQIAFTANANQQRSATLTILGVTIEVTQWPSINLVTALQVTAGNNQTASAGGVPFVTNLQVTAHDGFGNTVPGVGVTFSSPSVTFGGAYNTSYTVTTDGNGIATAIPMSATVAGPITVTATATGAGFNAVQFFQLAAVGGQFVAVAGSPQGVLLNQQFPTNLKVMVYDPNGNPMPGASVVFSVPTNGPSGTFGAGGTSATVQTGPDGSATAPPLTANGTSGSFNASAYYAAAAAPYINFGLTNYTNIYLTSGVGQSTPLNTTFSSNLTVLVVDQNANPTPGVPVTFTVNAGGSGASGTFSGGITTAVVPTGSNGIASAPALTANGTAGTFTVVVSAAGLPSQTFTLNNSVSGFNYGGNQSGATTRTLPQPFIVQVSSGATAGTMVFTVVPGAGNGAGGTFNGANPVTVNTDAQGYGTSPLLLANSTPGTFTVTAYDGITTAVTSVTTVECLNPGTISVVVSAANDSSLRNAVTNACSGSTIDLTQLTGTITLTSRLRIDDSITIVGPGASALAIDGGNATRLFFIGGGTVSISNLTLQSGLGTGGASSQGGAAAGMGGAIFMNGGTVNLSGVTFSGNQALGGSTSNADSQWGGGGFGAAGGFYSPSNGNGGAGGSGGDLFGLGGITPGGPVAGSGGAGGGGAGALYDRNDNGGNGGFGGGGGYTDALNGSSGSGGFGGGGGGGTATSPNVIQDTPGGGGFGGGTGYLAIQGLPFNYPVGGGGAGFGGAIFEYAGTLNLTNDQFLNDSAVAGTSAAVSNGAGSAANNGQGKGGALFIYYGAIAINNGSTFGLGTGAANIAADAGSPAIGNSPAPYTNGATCPGQDSVDICGTVLQLPTVGFAGPSYGVYGSAFSVTAESNSSAAASIVVTAGPCQVSGTTVTMTAVTGSCQLQAVWPATSVYAGSAASLSIPAAPIEVTPSVAVASKIFDGTTAATINGCSLSNVLPADAANVTCSATNAAFVSAGADVNITVDVTGITLAGPAAANYVLSANGVYTSANISFATPPSACVVAPVGVSAWWKADGNANDATGLYNGTLGGDVSFATGQVGQAFSFDGSQSPYVALPASAFPAEPSASPFTFETWFQTSATTGGVILGSQSGVPYGGVPGGWTPAIYVGTDGLLFAQMYWSTTENGITQITSLIPVNDGQWHHVAVTYDGSNEIVYLDGGAIGTITSLTQANNGTPLYYQLGTGYTGSGWPDSNGGWFTFTGLIDEPTVYSRVLAASEVVSIVQAGTYGKCNPGISVVPATLNFGSVAEGQNSTLSSLLSNPGNAPLAISSISADAGDVNFTLLTGNAGDCTAGTPVQPNSSCNVRVQFAPQTGGSLTGTVTIQDNSLTNAGTHTIQLSGSTTSASQTITFAPIPTQTVGTPLVLTASASSGLAVTYSSPTPSVCTVSVSIAALTAKGTCTIMASQAGNATYAPAPSVSQSFSVAVGSQTITFPAISAQTVGTPLTLSATASSGLPVTYTSSPASVCTVSGTTATFAASGTCTIKASQAGNSNYLAAVPVTRSFAVSKQSQSITWATIPTQTVQQTVALNATASSGLVITYTSSTATICTISGVTASLIAGGTCTIKASQAGNATYAAETVSQSFAVAKLTQTVTFPAIAAQNVGATATLAAAASSGLAVTYDASPSTVCTISGATVSFVSAGTCTLTAGQPGNMIYSAAISVKQTVTVGRMAQTITFPTVAPQNVGATVTLTATASSGLAVTYMASPSNVCSVSGTTATMLGAGTCSITAAQAGNATFSAAIPVKQTVTVTKLAQAITFPSITAQNVGATATLAAVASSGLAVTYNASPSTVCTISGTTVSFVGAGSCTLTAGQPGNAMYSAATPVKQTVTVSRIAQTITFPTVAPQNVGATVTLTATASSGLAVTYTASPSSVCSVSGTTATMIGHGTCSLTAAQAGNTTYAAATSVKQAVTVK